MPDDGIEDLPNLLAKTLEDIQDGFRKANAKTIQDGPFRGPGAAFRIGSGVVFEFKGHAQSTEGGGILFSSDMEAKGTETFIRVPVDVDQPPEGFPWQMASGGMILDYATRKPIYRAAITAIGFLSWPDINTSPVWRVGPGQYVVLVAKRGGCLAFVERSGGGYAGKSAQVSPAVAAIIGPLATSLTQLISAAVGGPEE